MTAPLLRVSLLVAISLPINTLAFSDANGPLIRVLVDPSFWGRIGYVPPEFEGFRVSVEPKGASQLFG
jgi:hypothetical protein